MRHVFVPSKGRPHGSTANLLRREGIPHTLVVEPHERGRYLGAGAAVSSVAVLPESGKGLAYSRQWTLDVARGAGHEWFWMLDDDITGFYIAAAERCVRTRATAALNKAEETLADAGEWGQASIDYQQYAWAARKPYVENSYCDVAVAIRTDTTARFRPEAGVKLDRDFTLQVLAAGQRTIRVTRVAFAAPTMGTNAGGLADEYAAGREAQASAWMEETWPGVASVSTKPGGRVDARIDWKKAAA